MRVLQNSLSISHDIVSRTVQPGDIVVDATAGNGYDTLFLAELVGDAGHVYSFDIQTVAIQNTYNRLKDAGMLSRVTLINAGHENMDQYVHKPLKAVMFNFGYLPGGDHHIATKPETSILAIEKAMNLIVKNGIVMMVIYYGGDSGYDEKDAILEYLKTIDYKQYSVLVHQFINQINCPPIAACIEKIK